MSKSFTTSIAAMVLTSISVVHAGLSLQRVGDATAARTFAMTEWKIDVGERRYENPFNPAEVDGSVVFTHESSGRVVRSPAFWMHRESSQGFFVRFAPPLPGKWAAVAQFRDKADLQNSDTQTIEVTASDRKGFVRRSAGTRYLRTDSGQSLFLLGPNIAWAGDKGLAAYDAMFAKLAAGGGNFARVWMAHPSRPMETASAGLGKYDQEACAFYDELFRLAEKHGIYLMVTFMNHRDLLEKDTWGPAQWPAQPHNSINGGPCTQPSDFITRSDMRQLYKQRLRYMVARYSAYTHLAFWEFWNEQAFTNVNIPAEWTIDMAKYLREIDPNAHLITNSFGRDEQPEVWNCENIDLVQKHYYAGWGVPDCTPAVSQFHRDSLQFDKPSLMGELGMGWDGSDDKGDPNGTGTNLHNGVWTSLASGGAGGASNWWWDNYIDKHNLWSTYRGANVFASKIDWAGKKFQPIDLPPVIDTSASPDAVADMSIGVAGGWGKSHGRLIQVYPNGRTNAQVPSYIYGYEQAKLRAPTVFAVDLPKPAQLDVHVAMVSDTAVLRVLIDGKPAADWFFSALPGSSDIESTRRLDGPKDIYQAKLNKVRSIDVPAGKHRIELANLGTDWITIGQLVIKGGRSASVSNSEALALQDAPTGETIVWLHDINSNWKSDQEKIDPQANEFLEVRIPSQSQSGFKAEWWDTRLGSVVAAEDQKAVDGVVTLRAPRFKRDIALRLIPLGSTKANGG